MLSRSLCSGGVRAQLSVRGIDAGRALDGADVPEQRALHHGDATPRVRAASHRPGRDELRGAQGEHTAPNLNAVHALSATPIWLLWVLTCTCLERARKHQLTCMLMIALPCAAATDIAVSPESADPRDRARLRQVKLLQLIVMEDAVEEGTLELTSGGDSVDQELHFRG